MSDYQFTIPLDTFDVSLLPPGSPPKGSDGYSAAVHRFLQEQFAEFKGDARIIVSEDSILVEWTPPPTEQDPVIAAVVKLEQGDLIPAIVMLELLRQRHPDDVRLLYNLGLAYSNLGRLEPARVILGEVLRLNPDHVNARVALGVAYAKEGRNREAVEMLERVVAVDPGNPWAQRNLGACLLALGEVERATSCLLRATELNPEDQQAFLGLAEAYRTAGNIEKADAAYRTVIALDEFSPIARAAKKRFSSLAYEEFRKGGTAVGRPDAIAYCLSALEHFAGLPQDEIQRIVFEIAVLGTKGLDVHDPTEKYELRSMPGKFSGLHLLAIMYTGFQLIAPDQTPSFDLSREFAVAKRMFEQQRGK